MTKESNDTIQRLRAACALNQAATKDSLDALRRCAAVLERETARAVQEKRRAKASGASVPA